MEYILKFKELGLITDIRTIKVLLLALVLIHFIKILGSDVFIKGLEKIKQIYVLIFYVDIPRKPISNRRKRIGCGCLLFNYFLFAIYFYAFGLVLLALTVLKMESGLIGLLQFTISFGILFLATRYHLLAKKELIDFKSLSNIKISIE